MRVHGLHYPFTVPIDLSQAACRNYLFGFEMQFYNARESRYIGPNIGAVVVLYSRSDKARSRSKSRARGFVTARESEYAV